MNWFKSIFLFNSFCLYHLPRKIQLLLGDFLGILWFDILRIRRKVILDNLSIAFPNMQHQEKIKIGRQSCQNLGRGFIEYSYLPFITFESLSPIFTIEGEEHLQQAQMVGKGGYMLCSHIANGDIALSYLALKKYNIHLISKQFKWKALNDVWFAIRKRVGVQFIAEEKSSFDILRALRGNGLVVFVLDQFMGPPVGVKTTFFGKETGTALGLALFAERTKAPVIPAYSYRRPDGSFHIVIEPPIPFEDSGDREQNIQKMTQKYTDSIESAVRKFPSQWMWVHRRWKHFG